MKMKLFEKLNTIQKRENLNIVYKATKIGNGGASATYKIFYPNELLEKEDSSVEEMIMHKLQFQQGARGSEDSVTGITDQDLLEIVRDRLTGFTKGNLSTRETAIALTHVENALLWLNKRTEDRIERGVISTDKE